MDFWNEAIPRLLRRPKPGSDAATSRRPRPGHLDVLEPDYANGSFAAPTLPPANVAKDNPNGAAGQMLEPPSNLGDGEPDKPGVSMMLQLLLSVFNLEFAQIPTPIDFLLFAPEILTFSFPDFSI